MKKIILSPIVLFLLVNTLLAQPKVIIKKFISGLTRPVLATHSNDDRLFIVEQAGRIKIARNGIVDNELFLNITDRVNSRNNEQGLLGLAFDPNFKVNGQFYVNYIANGTNRTNISRFQLITNNPNKGDSLSEQIILTIPQPFSNHNGGGIAFGPDGYLYIGMGDGGSANDPQGHGQNKKSLLAKMLRIDVDTTISYKIPPTNPFIKDSNVLPEIWSLGLRNPWRWSFDRATGDIWIGDVGQDNWEEVDFQPASSIGGENYGWRCFEGFVPFNKNGCGPDSIYTKPVQVFFSDVNIAGCSVTGGYVYRGNECKSIYGKYIYGDFCSGNIWSITRVNQDSFENALLLTIPRNQLSSFGEDKNGEIYVCTFGANAAAGAGEVYQLIDTSCSISISSFVSHPSCLGLSDGKIFINETNPSNCVNNYQWTTGEKTKTISNLQPGNYTLMVDNSLCSKTFNFELKFSKIDSICLTPLFVDKICENDSAIIIACDKDGVEYQWYLNNIEDKFLNGKRIFVKKSGTYKVRTIDSLGCQSVFSEEAKIIVHSLPLIPNFIRNGDSLIATAGYLSYVWYKDGKLLAGSTANYYVIKEKGEYCVQVIDSNQCRSKCSASMFIIPTGIDQLTKSRPVVLPNPSTGEFIFYLGDWINQESELAIYNLDGKNVSTQKIASGTKVMELKIEDLPSTTYFYQIRTSTFKKLIGSGKLVKN